MNPICKPLFLQKRFFFLFVIFLWIKGDKMPITGYIILKD